MREPNTAVIIVSSDRASSGSYQDQSGPAAAEWLNSQGIKVLRQEVLPDEKELLVSAIDEALHLNAQLIVISGGTGLGSRDVTPQVLDHVCDYQIPGFGELLRRESLKYSLNAYLSRCGAWVKDRCLILALPGNPKAVVEQLGIIADLLPHALKALRNTCDDRRAPVAAHD